jgi:hypothetical protein
VDKNKIFKAKKPGRTSLCISKVIDFEKKEQSKKNARL